MSPLEVDLLNKNTMDLLPHPKGSWADLNSKRQSVNKN